MRAAIAIHREVDAYNASQKIAGGLLLNIGIGLHQGMTVLGTVGEPERFDVTVISDAVNIGSRIEGLTKTLGIRCVLSQTSVAADFSVRPMGRFHVAGKSLAIDLVELLDVWDSVQLRLRLETRPLLEAGLEHFAKGQLTEASACFAEVSTINPEDSLVSYSFNACKRLLVEGIPDNFDGSLSFEKVA